MTIGIILYGNPDYYPPTINAIWLLEKKYKSIIFSRNIGEVIHKYGFNTLCYRFGKNTSVIQSEKKSPISKITEYLLFVFKTVFYSNKYKCKVIIAYEPFALVTALVLKIFNSKIKIFYHEHEISLLNKDKKSSLSYWVKKIAYKNLDKCEWISQPDIKRVEAFKAHFQNRFDVHLVRNVALRNYDYPKTKLDLYNKYEKEGYTICGYVGMLGKGFYIEELIKYIEKTQNKLLIVMAGKIRDNEITKKIKYLINKETIGKIIHLDFISTEEKYKLLNSIDFGLVLYSYERDGMIEMNAGSSTKVGEYLAFGLPVVYPEWWNYEAYYKEVGLSYKDGEEVIRRIEELSVNPDLRIRLSQNAKRLFNEKINFESEFREMEKEINIITST